MTPLIAIVYILVALVVAIVAMRLARAEVEQEFGRLEGPEAVAVATLGLVAGLFWPVVALGALIWRLAFPPKQKEILP